MSFSAPPFGSPAALAMGDVVAGRFEVERLAGAGGMGSVFRAFDRIERRPVALKVAREPLAELAPDEAARFAREARLLESLSASSDAAIEAGIVRYVAHGVLADGRPYLAMEWLEGRSLADRLDEGPLTVGDTLAIGRAVARALAASHRAGVVHRDVKPGNVFLERVASGTEDLAGTRVRLVDFGIARHTRLRGHTVTRTQATLGTPHYMAPEQVRGARSVGPAADVFSLGCLLYECIAGEGPFRHDSVLAALASVLLDEPTPLRRAGIDVPAPVESLVLAMLAKEPSERPADGDAALVALEAIAAGDDVESLGRVAVSRREQRTVLVLVALPSDALRAVEHTVREEEGDPTTLRMRALVEASEGRVELTSDRAIVASYGGVASLRDRVERALGCVASLVEADDLVRVALVTGRAVTGRATPGASGARAPVGAAVAKAMALASGIERGVALDEDVAAYAAVGHDLLAPRDGGPALLGPRRSAARLATTRLLGRDRELAALGASVEEALAEPITRLARLVGPAGIGKTRLLDALADELTCQSEVALVRVRAHASDREAPLALALRLVRAAADVREGGSLESRRAALRAHLEALASDELLARLERDLGALARVPSSVDAGAVGEAYVRGDRERRAFVDWLGLVAGARGVVLLVDDAQHADVTSLELLEHALAQHASRPLVVVLAETESEVASPHLGAAPVLAAWRTSAEVHRLARLLPRASRALVDAMLADVPEGVAPDLAARASIVERGEGNPFFLRELCAAALRGAEAPLTLLAAVEERIVRMTDEARRTLRALALLDEPCSLLALRAVLPFASLAELELRVDELVRAELAVLETRASSDGRTRVQPRSALVAAAAYAMIPDDERVAAHRLAGHCLRDEGAEAARVASHFERGEAWLDAARSYAEAAERALEAHDLARSEAQAERGLALLAKLDRATDATLASAQRSIDAELHLLRAQAARWSADYGRARLHAEASLASLGAARTADVATSRRWLEALGVWIAACSALGVGERAFEVEAALVEVAAWAKATPPDVREEVVALAVVALARGAAAHLGGGRRADAARWLDHARALRAHTTSPLAAAWLHTLTASSSLRDRDVGRFLDETERAIDAYERAGDARNACNQRVRLANALVAVGEVVRAEPLLVTAVDDAHRMGLALVEGYALQNLGHVRARLGRSVDARAALARAEGLGRSLQDGALLAGALVYRALLVLDAPDAPSTDLARALADASHAMGAVRSEGPFRAIAEAVHARAALASGDHDAASASATRAQRWLESHGPLDEGAATIRRAYVDVMLALGRTDEAHRVARLAHDELLRESTALPAALRRGFLEHPDHARLARVARDSPCEA